MVTDALEQDNPKNNTILSSGNPELDSRMGGGLPVGSLVLIEGTSGSGKSVLSQQILWGALNGGRSATIYTTENSVKSLVSQMQSIDLDILDFVLLSRCRIYPIELSQLGSSAPEALMQVIKSSSGTDVIVIDSFTAAMSGDATDRQVINFYEECKRLCAEGTTVLTTLHGDAIDKDLINGVRSLSDAHLVLNAEQDGQKLVKTLKVVKVRGASSSTGAIVGFDVEPGWGLRIIPISKARG